MTNIIGPALFAICLHWLIRWAVRAEIERAMKPRKPSAITEEVDAENRAVYTYPCPNCGCIDHE